MYDPFKTEVDGIEEGDLEIPDLNFYARQHDFNVYLMGARDGRGFSQTVHLRVPDGLVGAISKIVARNPNYESPHDFIRSWINHGIAIERNFIPNDEHVQEFAKQRLALAEMGQSSLEMEQDKAMFEKAQELIQGAIESGDIKQMRKQYSIVTRLSEGMWEGTRKKVAEKLAELDQEITEKVRRNGK